MLFKTLATPLTQGSLVLPLIIIAIAPTALAQSITPAQDGTGTQVNREGDTLDIHGGQLSDDGANLFHSFEQFGLSEGQIANFLSNPNIENILGRVVGGDASYINGLLQVSGGDSNLFLINPAGIVFGESARLNVAGDFTATTATGIGFGENELDVFGENSWSSLVGNPDAFEFATANPGSIVNEGNLEVSSGQNLGLFGGTVVNTGTLTTSDGNLTLSAVEGENVVRLSAAGNVLSLDVAETGIGEEDFTPLSLPQLLAGGEDLSHASQVAVNGDGTVSLVGSDVKVDPEVGTAIASGELAANGDSSEIQVLGNQVAVLDATLDVSGLNGGGNIFIGGDFQGSGTIPNARVTLVDGNTNIFADAIESGDGGRVILWADETTAFLGSINARGSSSPTPHTPHPTPSHGGFVEVSGKQNLIFDGVVDVSAVNGNLGTLLLDPANITISSGASTAGVDAALPDIFASDFDGQDITINAATLENQTGNVILEATNNITLDTSLTFTPGGGAIQFTADSDGNNVGSFLGSGRGIQAEYRDVTISGASVEIGSIDTSSDMSSFERGGDITLTATNGDITTEALNTSSFYLSGGDITLSATNGGITTGSLNMSSAESGTGTIDVRADGDISISSIDATSSQRGGNVTLNSDGAISTGSIDTSTYAFGSDSNNGGTVVLSGTRVTVAGIDTSGEETGGAVTLTATNGAVTANGTIETRGSNAGDVQISGNSIQAQTVDASGSNSGGNIALTSTDGNLTASNLNSGGNTGGNISLDATGGGITATTIESAGVLAAGDIDVSADSDIVTGNIDGSSDNAAGGQVSIASSGGGANLGSIDSSSAGSSRQSGGAIDIQTAGDISTFEITASAAGSGDGGSITLNASNGTISTSTLDSTSFQGDGGAIGLTASGDISTGSYNADTTDASAGGTSGSVVITSTGGSVSAGGSTIKNNITLADGGTDALFGGSPNADATADADTVSARSGSVVLQAYNDITLNEAIVSSTLSTLDLKAGRSIFLNADIDTSAGNGNIFLSANDADAAAGLRQAGIGGIFAAPGTTLDAGSGTIALSVGNAGTVGHIELANVNTTGVFSIETSGDILQPGANSLLSAGSIELMSSAGSVGTASDPLRVATNTLEASATDVFLDSPTQGITIGGVTGNIAGIETQPEGDVVLTALGDITISEGIDTSNPSLFNILNSGDITLESTGGNIQTGTLSSFARNGLGGNVQVTAAGDITATGDVTASSGALNEEPGGDIIFNSGGTIDTTASTLTSRSSSNAGGQIQLTAVGDINTGDIDAYSNDNGSIDKGNIVLNSTSGSIDTRAGSLDASGDVGGGEISVTAAGNIATSNISTASDNAGSGNIALNSNGAIDTTAGILNTSSASGNAGDVSLNAAGNITTGDIDTTVKPIQDNDVIDGTIFPDVGRAGDIAITSTSGSINTSNGELSSFSDNGFAIGGSVQVDAVGNVTTGAIRTEGTQEGGNIGITSSGTLSTTGDLTTVSTAGQAGNVTLNATGNISTANILSNSSTGQGGSLSATSNNGSITTGNLDTFTDASGDGGDIALQSSTTAASSVTTGNIRTQSNGGAGGDIGVTAFNNITAGDITTFSSLDSGDIRLTTIGDGTIQTGNITTETTSGVSGTISIDGNDVHTGNLNSIGITGSGDISVDADGNLIAEEITTETQTGDSGDIDVNTGGDANTGDITSETQTGDSGDIDVNTGGDANTGDITTETQTGDSGDIDVNAGDDANTGDITTQTQNGDSGDIDVNAGDDVNTGDITSQTQTGDSGDIGINAGDDVSTGDITSQTQTGDSGDIGINAGDDVSTGDITSQTQTGDSGDLNINAGGDINTEIINSIAGGNSGDITLNAGEDITTADINSIAGGNSGDITLTSENGSITTGDIASLAETGTSGDIGLDARGDINTGDITTQGALGSGDISLNSREGEINTGILTTDGDILINGILNGENEADSNAIDPLTGAIESDRSSGTPLNFGDRPLGTIPVDPASALNIARNFVREDSNTNNDSNSSNVDRRNTEGLDFAIAQKVGGSFETFARTNNLNVLNNNSVAISTAELADLDRQRTNEYTDYLGKEDDDESGGVENAKEALAKIAAQTGNQSAVVYVTLLPNQIELVLFTPEGVPIRQVIPDVAKEEVLATARELRRYITHPRHHNSDRYLESAQQLYQWLIAPLKDKLTVAQTDTLLFSMDEGLRALPMAALHDGKQFLVEQYSFSMIPSLSLIDTRYRALQNTQALGMGASKFTDLNPLPAVPVELSAITQHIWQGEAFLNESFTRDNLIAERQEFSYPIVHLATHGEFQSGDPSNSYIQLWDEKLRLNELRTLGWSNPAVELLVLSACKTAVGDPQAELGFAGLAVAAGVKSAMASLWHVSDEGTLALMTEFYSHLSDSQIKAEALRQAQIDMIRGEVSVEAGELRGSGLRGSIPLPPELAHLENTNLSHPYYWSAFTTIGSPW